MTSSSSYSWLLSLQLFLATAEYRHRFPSICDLAYCQLLHNHILLKRKKTKQITEIWEPELFPSRLRLWSLKLMICFLSHWCQLHAVRRVIIRFAILRILHWKQVMWCIFMHWLTSILLINAPETCPSSILFFFFNATSILAEYFRDVLRAIFLQSVLGSLCFSTFLFSSNSFYYLIQTSYFL